MSYHGSRRNPMKRLRSAARLWPALGGLVGGLLLGLALSRRGDWQSPLPWLVYGLLLVLLFGLAAWWSERRRL